MPSDARRKEAKKKRRGNRAGRKAAENLAVAKLRAEVNDAWFKTTGYLTGGLEQLGHQIGQVMTMQSAMLEYLERRHNREAFVTAQSMEEEIKSIIEAAKVKYEAEQEQKRQEAEAVKAKKEQEKLDAAAEQAKEVDAEANSEAAGEVEQNPS